MQTVSTLLNGHVQELSLPDVEDEVVPGVLWGAFDQFFTPAYWATQIWMLAGDEEALSYKLGSTLKEEVAACLLGGHGITAEMCLAAYDAVRQSGLLQSAIVTSDQVAKVLKQPLSWDNRAFRYRFPNRKAQFLAPVLNALSHDQPQSSDHKSFRNWFMQFPGIGWKTASWITRNWLGSNEVAILDIHVIRGGRICGLFRAKHEVARNYPEMERSFLHFARKLLVDAAKLDVLIWQQMRQASSMGLTVARNAP